MSLAHCVSHRGGKRFRLRERVYETARLAPVQKELPCFGRNSNKLPSPGVRSVESRFRIGIEREGIESRRGGTTLHALTLHAPPKQPDPGIYLCTSP
jgi:hypothetical protein